jgi:hypothetical protein
MAIRPGATAGQLRAWTHWQLTLANAMMNYGISDR